MCPLRRRRSCPRTGTRRATRRRGRRGYVLLRGGDGNRRLEATRGGEGCLGGGPADAALSGGQNDGGRVRGDRAVNLQENEPSSAGCVVGSLGL